VNDAVGRGGALSRADRDREVVQRTAELLTSNLSLEALFHAVCSLLARFVDASMVFIAINDREGARIAFMLENGVVGKLENRRVRPESRTAEVLREGRPVLKRTLEDWTEGRLALNLPGQPQNDERVSAIFVPLKFGTEIIGALSVQSVRPHAYSDEDVNLVQTCALYLSVRVHQAQLETQSARLENMASTDSLTGVANRRSFDQRLSDEWRRAIRRGTGISMMLIDIDFFKPFNDTYGHVAGDAALQQVATALTSCLSRSEDFFARYGGEEFVAVLPGTELPGALQIAERMRQAVLDLGIAHSGSLLGRLTISAGVAYKVPARSTPSDSLIEAADVALYQAKRTGRNRVAGENYRSDAPPAYPAKAYRHNLPSLPGETIGRGDHLQQLRRLLRGARLLTIVGAGGAGKSREAIDLAHREMARFPDGVFYVDCSAIQNASYLANKVAAALGVVETLVIDARDACAEYLKSKKALLLLDNCESVETGGAADYVRAVLAEARDARILVTCREPLMVGGETAFVLPGLAVEDAVALFLERARAVAGVSFADKERSIIEQICRQLDGRPRAIQLAAAQLGRIDAHTLLQTLPDLTQMGRQAMRGFVEWSYNVLSAEEQSALRALAVFAGGATALAIAEVCGGTDCLSALVEKSFVSLESVDGVERYVLPAAIRVFAQEQARALGEWEALGMRHARYFCERAKKMERSYSTRHWRRESRSMAAELDNLRAALLFTVTEEHHLELGADMSAALVHYWEELGRIGAGRDWIEQLLARSDVEFSKRVRAELYYGLARLDGAHSQKALDAAHTAIALFRELRDDNGLAKALYQASAASILLRRVDEALKYLDEGQAICKRTGDLRALADVYNGRAIAENWLGNPQKARHLHEQSLELLRKLEDDRGVASLLGNLGDLAATVGEYDRAVNLTRQSLAMFERLHDPQSTGWVLTNLGTFELKRGDVEAARPALRRALELVREYPDEWLSGNCVDSLARLALAEKDWGRALRLAGFADGVFDAIGVPRQPFDQLDYENVVREAQNALGLEAAREALDSGRAMQWTDALKEAQQA
jgi:non-specific serine/threonine protein kinase